MAPVQDITGYGRAVTAGAVDRAQAVAAVVGASGGITPAGVVTPSPTRRPSVAATSARRAGLQTQRLLAHTDLPVAAIGRTLGFTEATDFGKLFTREVGCAPGDFRRSQW
ncbi:MULTISPECIES: helix-turn-helix domain-containing protein [Kitasatospora]|uniref:HTH araC/xylS-type domain-containing protein n=1 Tax=Kitasatospora cystarginea TaxID=58350 RepID=A0ABN3F0I5_9ACTN